MAASTVITSDMLALAGVTGAVATALSGKTIAEAADLLLDVVRLSIANARLTAKDVVSYTLQGQSVTTSMDDASKLVDFLVKMKSAGRGPVILPIVFKAP
jgi:hypothetical protein